MGWLRTAIRALPKVIGYGIGGVLMLAWYGGIAIIGGGIAFLVIREAVQYCQAHPTSNEAIGIYLFAGSALLWGVIFGGLAVASLRRRRAPALPDASPPGGKWLVPGSLTSLAVGLAGIVLFLGSVKVHDFSSTSGFCNTHNCIANFSAGAGSIVECTDGTWSHSGGLQRACSYHGGEASAGASRSEPSPSVPVTPEPEAPATTRTTKLAPPPAASTATSPSLSRPSTNTTTATATVAPPPAPSQSSRMAKVCYPARQLPAVHLPAVHIPARTIPGFTVAGQTYPPQHVDAIDIPGQTISGQTVPRICLEEPEAFAPDRTTVRVSGYEAIDPSYSPKLTQQYWSEGGPATEAPDPTASGFGELNGAGFPKDQYVRPYIRSDGTAVEGYWRNSPSDGLPTCQVIKC